MKKQILINNDEKTCSVSLLEDGKLKEYYIEYPETNRITGNIYKGRVVNVLNGLQTAFVDVGLNKNGFLYVGETLDHKSVLSTSGKIPSKLDVKENDFVMVQVVKEETGDKGARISVNLSLPGRYVVFLPTIEFVGISNKISDPAMREKLTKMLEKVRPKGGGFIARTICMDAKKSDILEEVKQLEQLYEKIKRDFDAAGDNVTMLHSEGDLVFRTVRDIVDGAVEDIIANDINIVNRLVKGFTEKNSRYTNRVRYFESEYDMYDVFNIFPEVDKLLDNKVQLPSGGSLVIDKTEALTVIDVNTGRYTGSRDHEETVFKTNVEAAAEIARQLRLRNIGGIIIVDFIDMNEEEHKTAVVETLRREMVFDRTKCRVLDMSELGLVEITRKKVGKELGQILLDVCPYCKGSAHTHSGNYIAFKLKAALKKLFADGDYNGAIVTVNAGIAAHMVESGYFRKECEGIWSEKRIYIVPDEVIKPRDFKITGVHATYFNLPANAFMLY